MEFNPAHICNLVSGAAIDSRGDLTGQLFVPIAGDRVDGHDFIAQAVANGAVCALTEQDGREAGLPEGFPLIRVASTRRALVALAEYRRSQFAGPVVAITGSAGKTTTKDMVAAVLSQHFVTHKTPGNYNNDLGLPLTLLNCPKGAQAMVLEMGMNHMYEISALTRIGRPTVAMITNIGDAHIENLGSRANILKAKSEIFEGLMPGGTVVLNGDDPLLGPLPPIPHAGLHVYCGKHTEAENRVAATMVAPNGIRGTHCHISWEVSGQTAAFRTEVPLPGQHMVMNALMATAVGAVLGLSPAQVDAGIRQFMPSGNRMDIQDIQDMTVVNDTYNASPGAVKAVIDMLAGLEGRKVCILGDMLELGAQGPALHREVGTYAAQRGMDALVAIGPLSQHTYEAFVEAAPAFSAEAAYFATAEAFISQWEKHLMPGDTVLVKASRGMALENIIAALR